MAKVTFEDVVGDQAANLRHHREKIGKHIRLLQSLNERLDGMSNFVKGSNKERHTAERIKLMEQSLISLTDAMQAALEDLANLQVDQIPLLNRIEELEKKVKNEK